MATEITWLGHNTWFVESGSHRILIDPFLDDSPTAPRKAGAIETDSILVSHGHYDHLSDAVNIAARTGAQVIGNYEICQWLKKQGVAEEKTLAMNLGGSVHLPFGRLTMTLAHHSSSLPDGTYGGTACGFLIQFVSGGRIYFACDTALFLEMKLIGMNKIDMAMLPIGDLFTMGPDESVEAIKFLNPKKVVPCHYNTWPPIVQDAEAWAAKVQRHSAADPILLEPGEHVTV
ncbi:MAG: metal-dependent hydrolase [Pirellulales bacterium]|nr:metal-dependent hydrolase [Pirellulales bacterium]